jgi:hypothetical protein
MSSIARRGDLQNLADRLDPERATVRVDDALSRLESAVELRLGKKSTRHFQALVG